MCDKVLENKILRKFWYVSVCMCVRVYKSIHMLTYELGHIVKYISYI